MVTGTQAAVSCTGTGAVQLPIPGPPPAGQAAKGMNQTAAPSPASQPPSAGETAQATASKALAGKDLAAKLAADFAQQHRSRQSAVAAVVGSQTAVAVAAAMATQAAAAVDVSAAIKAAAASAAEKVLQDRAARAKAAAEKHIHEQVLRAKQSVQSSGDVHAARMEAIRLRNAARHGSPQAPAVLPAAADQAAATAVEPEPQLRAQGAALHHLAKSQHPESISDDNSRSRKKRGRDEDHVAPVEHGTELDLPGPPAHRVADLSSRRRSRRSNSPASAGSRDSLRRQRREYSSESRQVAVLFHCSQLRILFSGCRPLCDCWPLIMRLIQALQLRELCSVDKPWRDPLGSDKLAMASCYILASHTTAEEAANGMSVCMTDAPQTV